MPYLDIFWSEKALSLAMNGKDYDIIDYYCVTPDCNCTEIELEFYERPFKVGFRRSDFSFIYDYEEKRAIEIKGISYGQAESIILGFTEKTNEIFRKRHKKLKSEVEPCILEKLSKYKRVNVSKRTNVSGEYTKSLEETSRATAAQEKIQKVLP